ncbi:hypothetical protein [Sphingomonas jaspsi]|uniref:hypothetical protein n=1 Tax=Sphingomonas jaspsi TaxID=392409 RepID=UPI000687F823|nr:hypothetical protein [Sphingomonas jaspsi]
MPGRTNSSNAGTAPSASQSRRSPLVDDFGLTGTSLLPDPRTHAYRKDLADASLAGRVIASHYAEPLVRHLVKASPFYVSANDTSEVIASLDAGTELRMLDNSRGWAWGYGPDGLVGYVRSDAVGI